MSKIASSIAVFFIASFFLISCESSGDFKAGASGHTEMSSAEKEAAKREISARLDEIFKGLNDLDIPASMEPYSNEPDFKIVNLDASVMDYQTMMHTQVEGFKSLAAVNFKTTKTDFLFLEKDLVMCTWTGRTEAQSKKGKKIKVEPYVISMLFRKRNNQWKIVYSHESAAPANWTDEGLK